MPRVGPACAVSKLSGTFDENELELAASPGPRRAGSSIDPTSADKIKKLEAALEQVLVFFTCACAREAVIRSVRFSLFSVSMLLSSYES